VTGNAGASVVADLGAYGQRTLEELAGIVELILAERQRALLVGEEGLTGSVARRPGRV
jgi:hypothetical protein